MRRHPHYLWKDLFKNRQNRASSVIELLKENALFHTLNAKELKLLSKMVYERVYQPDEVIFHQNERGFGMYIIAKGRVDIKTEGHEEAIAYQVTNGKNGMPAFGGKLSADDIADVAAYVESQSSKGWA